MHEKETKKCGDKQTREATRALYNIYVAITPMQDRRRQLSLWPWNKRRGGPHPSRKRERASKFDAFEVADTHAQSDPICRCEGELTRKDILFFVPRIPAVTCWLLVAIPAARQRVRLRTSCHRGCAQEPKDSV